MDTLWARIRRAVADGAHAHRVLWESMDRIAPDPDPALHWEPTASGWRLYGQLVPPEPCELRRRR